MQKPFLTAEWQKLLLVNFPVEPDLLQPFIPQKTELDIFDGNCLVSMVGFMFLYTRLKGIPVPFHQHFEEVNLRFYVRYKEGKTWKRGAVFIGEFVPKPMIALVARTIYQEPYSTKKMEHNWLIEKEKLEVTYKWKTKNWNSMWIRAENKLVESGSGSEEEFITEHYWGYTRRGAVRTDEYSVEHPRWKIYPTLDHKTEMDFAENYGQRFGILNSTKPSSAFLAEGSNVLVREGKRI